MTPIPPVPSVRLIEVLGPGCAKCQETYRVVCTVLEAVGVSIPVEKVESYERMTALGILSTPAVAVDGQVVVSGRIPTKDDIQAILALILKNTPMPAATTEGSGGCSCKGGCA